jgi:pantoate--beta-alanine ligase
MLQISEDIETTRAAVTAAKARGLTVGLVPTMGALHAGHISLLRAARRECGFVVASIFVNPTQFGPHEDLARYPRPLQQDLAVCAAENVDLVFHPAASVMYPPGYHTYVEVEQFQEVLCGASQPGHFRGVATIVLKLFNIVRPDVAYFGQKDAQQARLLEQLVRDLNVPVRIDICPIARAADGLALSSRNQYLDALQRQHATVLFRSLQEMQCRIAAGERVAQTLLDVATQMIAGTPGARLDYAAAVDYATLQPLELLHGKVLLALAVYFGSTRLIDNVLIDIP